MAKCVAAGASDLGMPDAMKIGGVTGWLRAAAIAESAGLPVSSHLFPEVSAHLLAVSPTCHWLEYVDWANPILREPLRIEGGQAVDRGRARHRHRLERRERLALPGRLSAAFMSQRSTRWTTPSTP